LKAAETRPERMRMGGQGSGGSGGRRKKSLADKKLEGNLRTRDGDAAVESSLVSLVVAIERPENLSEPQAIAAWNAIIPTLMASGRISAEDVPSIVRMMEAYQDTIRLQKLLSHALEVGEPLLIARLTNSLNTRERLFVTYSSRFGVTPSDRAHLALGMSAAGKKKKSLLDEVAGQGKK
jgi:hypothetical protein